jgi:hypothetical protein
MNDIMAENKEVLYIPDEVTWEIIIWTEGSEFSSNR